MAHMEITYYNTLYNKEMSYNVSGGIEFGLNGGAFGATFKSGGHKYFINAEYIIKIEELNNVVINK